MTPITLNLPLVRQRIALAAKRYERDPGHIRLLAVSKKQSAAAVGAALDAGQTHFGESYVQEGIAKREALGRPATWHFVGRIQKNKTRDIAAHFDWVHTVDRATIARRLADQRPSGEPLQVLIQVNLSDDPERAGVAPAGVLDLAAAIDGFDALRLRGLMVLPPRETDFERQRLHFRHLAELAARCRAAGLPADELSMGMSGDLEAAIAEGATWVRIGTALFGPRPDARYSNEPTRD